MVHSGSAPPMKTTASSQLMVTVTAPPLQADPLVPPSGDTTNKVINQSTDKFHSKDLTSSSDLTQTCTLTPADAEPPVVTQATPLPSNFSPASSLSTAPILALPQGSVNGRTSGRKRTPKACDCCGPNSTGHNVRTYGRGRGRGRGRGGSSEHWDTPKRKVHSQLTRIRSFDLTKEDVEEAVDKEDTNEMVQHTETVALAANTQSLPFSVSSPDGPRRSSAAPVQGDVQSKEDMLVEGSAGTGIAGNAGGDDKDVEIRLLGISARGATIITDEGRENEEVRPALKMEVEDGVVSSSKTYALPHLEFIQRPNKDAKMDHGGQPDTSTVKTPFGNGDTVNLSDTEPEEEAKGDNTVMNEMENGLPSCSLPSGPASGSGSSQDLDCEMQVDQIPGNTNSVSVPITLSNGSIPTQTNEDHCATLMEVETSSSSSVVAPPCQGPITVSLMQHHWALRDHRLYCQPGTWEKGGLEDISGRDEGEINGEEECLEQLTDLIHEFLESFYIKYGSFIPLSETDVLEYLKNKGNSDPGNSGVDIKREMARYRAGLASAPVAGFMVMYNKHTLGLEDLGTLEEQNWLNDQIINMYGELIMEATQHKVHFFNSFFHKQLVAKGYDGVKRWTKKVDLFSKWLLLIPIHLEIHWSLITVTMATKTISYYDSQGIVFRHTTDNIMKYLLSEAREKKQTAFQKGWKITIIKGIPQQKNDSDCGVFVLEYCRRLSMKEPLLFSQEDMPRIRKRIYKELCECRLND